MQRRPAARAPSLALLFAVAPPIGFAWLVQAPVSRGVVAASGPGVIGCAVMPAP